MKTPLFLAVLSFGSAATLWADSNIVLTGVHNCCKKCDTGIAEAVTKVEGASVKTEKGKVTVTAKDEATAKLAVQSLVSNGYFGQGAVAPAVVDQKVKSATVTGLHLCCGKCVTAAEEAVLSVAGVTGHTAAKGVTSFKVEGDFSTQQLANALHKAGLHGDLK
jgi:mercuric ion binding protein